MSQNSGTKSPNRSLLNISNQIFKSELQERIEIGEELFNREISNDQELETMITDYKTWNEYNFEYLKQSFNEPNNEYKKVYNQSGYSFVGSLGEVRGKPILSQRNLIKYKLDSLKRLEAKATLIKSVIHKPEKNSTKIISKKDVFIVHGHDELAKTKAARLVHKLGLNPIILHEQASSGTTIIEKIEKYSNVGFGIVLYTACDVGATKLNKEKLNNRARQNVVFEHGYLIGKIGRRNVCALVKDEIEVPNDISGVVYIPMNEDDDSWGYKLAKEMKVSGLDIDMNKL